MRGFLISALAETRLIRFCSFIFSIIESSDCIDTKISTDSLYSLASSFILSHLQEPKSTSSQQYSKRYLCFLLFLTLDNERVNWFNIIQLLVFLACLYRSILAFPSCFLPIDYCPLLSISNIADSICIKVLISSKFLYSCSISIVSKFSAIQIF